MKRHRFRQLVTKMPIIQTGNLSLQIGKISVYTFIKSIYITALIHKCTAISAIVKEWVVGVNKIIYISSPIPNTANVKTFAEWA